MLNIDYPFVRVGLQLLFSKVSSKMHWLPCRGLAASITPRLHEQPKSVRFLLYDQNPSDFVQSDPIFAVRVNRGLEAVI